VAQFTGQRRANHHLADSGLLDEIYGILIDLLIAVDDQFSGLRMSHRAGCYPPNQSLMQALSTHIFVSVYPDPGLGAAVVRVDDDVLCDVNQAAR
jgi:hypothetical protein